MGRTKEEHRRYCYVHYQLKREHEKINPGINFRLKTWKVANNLDINFKLESLYPLDDWETNDVGGGKSKENWYHRNNQKELTSKKGTFCISFS
jgi:hypothetical protein